MTILDENVLILTANARLSEYLRKKYDEEQMYAGKKTWHTLNCVPLNKWIVETTENLLDSAVILNDVQEFALWEKIISQANTPDIVYQPWKIAEIAQQAWRLLKQWRIPLGAITEDSSEDVQLFYQWATLFSNTCQKQQWHIQSDCAELLANWLNAQKSLSITLPEKILLAGFDEFTPHIQHLIDALKNHSSVDNYQMDVDPISIMRVQYLDEEEELSQMSHWAKKIIEEMPKAKIACVVPNLSSIRDKISRIFTETFVSEDHEYTPFNISAGRAFPQYPMIHMAFEILSLHAQEISVNKISAMLRSPFVGYAQKEMISRAKLSALLYENQERAMTLSTVMRIAQKNALCPLLISHLKNFTQAIPANNEKNYLSVWIKKITIILDAMGWPGERTLNSEEYQQLQRWQKLLIEFSEMEVIYEEAMIFSEAVSYLKTLSQKILFQPESQEAPIQILGMLEVSGMKFDYLWVMGMNDDKWPPSAVPNPFIPLKLQRKYQMPHASSEREFSFAHLITKRLSQSAEHIVFSYSQQKNDAALRVSKLIESVGKSEENYLKNMPINFVELEKIEDKIGPRISDREKVRGGSSILKDQAACPFRAFAKHRLGARKIPFPVSGLSSQERGNIIHEILENIWTTLKNQENLRACEESVLAELINKTTFQVLSEKAKLFPFALKKTFLKLENQRLSKLVQNWLHIEKQRSPFEVVSHEAVETVNFDGLSMRLRIDREDKLQNGKHVIIDYKTGITRVDDWFGDRPSDPQLPLYCLTSDHAVDGLIFAQIRSGDLQFKGIASEDIGIEGVRAIDQQKIDVNIQTWESFEEIQRQVLSKISQDFQSGKSIVDPKNNHETCQFCELHALCRIHDD